MNELPNRFESGSHERFVISPEKLKRTLMEVNNIKNIIAKKANELEKVLEPGDSKLDQVQRNFKFISSYLGVLAAVRKNGENPLPTSWDDLLGNDAYDSEPVPIVAKNAAGAWEINQIDIAQPSDMLHHVSWAEEIEPADTAAEAAPKEVSATMQMIRGRMPGSTQQMYSEEPVKPAHSKTARDTDLMDRLRTAPLGSNAAKKKRWFGR